MAKSRLTLNQAERKELITALVTNCAGWDADDIELLVNMSDEKLYTHAQGCAQLIANAEIEDAGDLPDSLEPASASEDNAAAEKGDDEQTLAEGEDQGDNVASTEEDTEGVKDQPTKCHDDSGNEIECPDQEGETKAEGENVQNEAMYLNSLPPRIHSVITNALRFEQAQKQRLVANIKSNPRNRFHDSYLMRMGLDELQALSEIAAPRKSQASYAGAASPTTNVSTVDRDDLLVPPVLEFTMSK
jgi:hypothetical protein